MDIVTNLLAFVAENPVFTAFKIAPHKIAEKAVQFNPVWFGPVRQPPRRQQVGRPK